MNKVFALDPRGLAIFRIILGTVICVKILYLLPYIDLTLTDQGVMPLTLLTSVFGGFWTHASVYSWFASSNVLYGVAAVHFFIALAFVAGWHTRIMTVLLLYFTLSLNMRNPLLLNGGDRVIISFLWWGIFLPLGTRFALDAFRPQAKAPNPFLIAFGSACFMLQVVIIYLVSGCAKTHETWIPNFVALECALRNESYATPLGTYLLNFPGLLKGFTVATLFIEQYIILLLLLPVCNTLLRTAISLVFIFFHIGIALTIDVGLFSYACIAFWMAVLPAPIYDWMSKFFRTSVSETPKHDVPPQTSPAGYLAGVLVMLLLVGISTSPYAKHASSPWGRIAGQLEMLQLQQRWKLYAPAPSLSSRFFSVIAVAHSGAQATLYPSQEKNFKLTEAEVIKEYPNFYIRKYFHHLIRRKQNQLYDAALRGFAAVRLPHMAYEDLSHIELVTWEKRHYPEKEDSFAKLVTYRVEIGEKRKSTNKQEPEK